MKGITINQKHYGKITLDNSEKDVIEIHCQEKQESQIIHIEKGNAKLFAESILKLLK